MCRLLYKSMYANASRAILLFFQLVSIPAKITIEDVFDEYLKDKKKKDQNAIELCEGLRQYFNTMLGSQLLYRFERSQFDQVFNIMKLQRYNKIWYFGNTLTFFVYTYR